MFQDEAAKLGTLDSRALRRHVMSLAWPVMAEMLLQTLVQVVSMVMVGRLGAVAVTSIGLSTAPLNVVYAIFQGVGIGATAVVARLVGGGHEREAGRASMQATVVGVILAACCCIFMLFGSAWVVRFMGAEESVMDEATRYMLVMTPGLFFMWVTTVLSGALRGAGDTRSPMKVNIIINVINVILNALLVYGLLGLPALGVYGAGLATTISRVVGGLIMLVPYLMSRTVLMVRVPDDFALNAQLIARVSRVGIPAVLERAAMSTSLMLYSRIIAGLGSIPFAAHTIGLNAESISFMPGNGFGTAATTLVGQSLGADRPDLAERSTWESFKMAALFVGAMGIVFLLVPEKLIGVYTSDPEVIRLASIYLRMMAFCQVHQVAAVVFTGALRGAGDTQFVMYISAVTEWLLFLGVTYLLVSIMGFDVVGAWWGMITGTLSRAIACILWFRTGRWKHRQV